MNLPSIIQEAYKGLLALFAGGWHSRQHVLNAVAVITAGVVLWQTWFSYGQVQLVMFVGPAGSSTAQVGPRLVEEIAKNRNASGVRYRVSLEPTLENVSISERMAFESSRIPLGIIEDGLGESDGQNGGDLRALLPMEWDYLFVLCSRTLLAEVHEASGSKDLPATLADVIHFAKQGKHQRRLFLGPEKTSSHKMAKLALEKYGALPDEHLAKGIADWREMRAAFKAEELDLAFYSGPIGGGLIEDVAHDEKVVLLGLGDITEAIQHETGFQYYAARLPRNLVLAKAHVPRQDSRKSDSEVEFCRGDLQTIASRRVLACPRLLSTADAFLIASVARGTLQENGYRINLQADDPPYGADSNLKCHLRMLPHPGLELLKNGKSPLVWRDWNTWPGWAQAAASILLGLLALDALRLMTSRIDRKPTEKQPPATDDFAATPSTAKPTNDDYAGLDRQLTSYEAQVDEKTHRDIAKELAEWDERLRDLRKAIHRSPGLTEPQRESLSKRYRILAFEIESSPNWVAKVPPKRGKSERTAEALPHATPIDPAG
ncbi:MAG: hypothetical protein EXS05_12595 [Planctomycetaceae bacterium]|nr:hypothetical protein [Planctomycetaceae bacterium]